MGFLIATCVVLLLTAGLGAWVATQRHRGAGEGLVLGLLFGPFGVLVEALLPAGTPAKAGAFVPHKKRRSEGYRFEEEPEPAAFIVGDDEIVRWSCRCGEYRTAPVALIGQNQICPKCRENEAVPG